ncbi:hypothetical protein A1O3_02933 [Capronia epimyces CBS 606.96]|uniref:F-box domain-containing protein n=1 Tax=Capronia epimyces CBS 606.96 TaxID=1182542 RepID=W9YKX6_9EURO|nr:uncharacterized protein A1O3_02933 [Capronia epimyces CBS 606.96]EXJ89866.1 hypothetical protein A1O3_02933 [Capronia epimyces CBS 606.96]
MSYNTDTVVYAPESLRKSSDISKHLSLPDEILIMILSNLVRPEVILFNNPKDPDFLHRQCLIFPLRLVSYRFRAIVDVLLADNFPKDLWLIGALPIYDRLRLHAVSLEYRNTLRMMLSPLLRSKKPFILKVHLLPELISMRAEVNWDMDPSASDSTRMKDDCTAGKAMTAHYATAVVLSEMLRKIFQDSNDAVKRGRTHVIFYEVDGSSEDAPRLVAEIFQQQPTVLPFWDFNTVCGLVSCWQWIHKADPDPGSDLSHFITLPVVAMTTESSRPAEWVFDHCSRRLMSAWQIGRPWTIMPSHSTTRIKLFGVHWKVYRPRNEMFSLWLTTLSPGRMAIQCFAIRGAGVLSNGDSRRQAVLLERPSSLLKIA